MGDIKEELKERGYNTFERGIIYSGIITGSIAPAAAIYGILVSQSDGRPLAHIIGAVAGIAIDLIPFTGVPAALYGAVAGGLIGGGISTLLRNKRKKSKDKKESLEGKVD